MKLILPVIAGIYLAAIWLDSVKDSLVVKVLGRPLAFFTQEAGLFPKAAVASIDYRAEGWACKEERWVELNLAPDFPMDSDHKENRFSRFMGFYLKDMSGMAKAIHALEDYLVSRNNRRALDAAAAGDKSPPPLISGVRLLSLRIPLGKPGEPSERYVRRPLEAYPEEMRKYWFRGPELKPEQRLKEQCKKLAP